MVAFYHHNQIQLGIVEAITGNNTLVNSLDGSSISLIASRIVLCSMNTVAGLSGLELFVTQVNQSIEHLDLPGLFAAVSTPQEGFTFAELTHTLAISDDVSRFAFLMKLKNHPELAACKADNYHIRSSAEREQYLQNQAVQKALQIYLESVYSLLDDVLSNRDQNPHIKPESDFRMRLCEDIFQMLTKAHCPELAKTIRSCHKDIEWDHKIIALRRALQDVNPETDDPVILAGIPVAFLQPPVGPDTPNVTPRRDCTHLNIFSIDDADTLDIDDAFSWETYSDHYILGIHISDVTAALPADSLLYSEARKRVSSLYLPTENVPMLPPEIAYDKASLKAEEHRPALSLFVTLDNALNFVATEFCQTTVCVRNNFSYREIDKRTEESPFCDLFRLQHKLLSSRNNGSNGNQARFFYYTRVKNGNVELKPIDNQSPSRRLVAEMMILFNSLFAEYAFKNNIPVIYRNIERFLSDATDPDSAVIGSTAYLSVTPDYHHGIGTEAYIHATSPIRRFTDLVNQYQICNSLNGQNPPFDIKALENHITEIERTLSIQREVISATERYWFLRFLEKSYLHYPLPAKILKHTKHGAVVELSDWNRKIQVSTDAYAPINTSVMLVIMSIETSKLSADAELIL